MSNEQKYYAGIGSRKTPPEILNLMVKIGCELAKRGFILRSGGAAGADSAFEKGCDSWYIASGMVNEPMEYPCPKQIFLAQDIKDDPASHQAMEEAKRYHPAWGRMNMFSRKLHARNAFQILGRGMHAPSNVVICWTPDGCLSHQSRTIVTGGTGTAISIAQAHKIPILNLRHEKHIKTIKERLGVRL